MAAGSTLRGRARRSDPKLQKGTTMLACIVYVPSAPIAVAPYVKTLQLVSSW